MNKRFTIIASILMSLLLVSCGNEEVNSSLDVIASSSSVHTHTYNDTYSQDENYHWYATSCGHDEIDGVLEKLPHVYGDWNVTTAESCESSGVRTRNCLYCGYAQNQEIVATGHNYSSSYTYNEEAHWHASTCGHEVVDGYEAHSFTSWLTSQEETCLEDGERVRYCTVCFYKETESVAATGHTYSSTYEYDETSHWHPSTCGHDEVSDKEAHIYDGNFTVIKEATETIKGIKFQSCLTCGYIDYQEIDTTDHVHTYSSNYVHDETSHWHPTSCGHDEVEGVLSKQTHEFTSYLIKEEASCESAGEKIRYCLTCGYYETETIPATGHSYSSIWSYDENGHYHKSTCQDDLTSDYEAHSYGDPEVLVQASCDINGLASYTCSVCGYKDLRSIDPIGHSYSSTYSYDSTGHWNEATCGHSVKVNFSEHNYGSVEVVTAATCTEEGIGKVTCQSCGYATEVSIEPTGHSYSSTYKYDGFQHYHPTTCGHDDLDGVITYEDHTLNENGVCSVCGYDSLAGLAFTLNDDGVSYSVAADSDFPTSYKVPLNIPSTYNGLPVTTIAKQAFREITSIYSVSLPSSIVSVLDYAFYKCTNIKSVSFEEGLEELGYYSFAYCSGISSLSFPSTLKTIGQQAFTWCTGLNTPIIIPDSVTSLGIACFSNSSSIPSITLPKYITEIPLYFAQSSLIKSIIIPEGVTTIGQSAFYSCKYLKYVDIPEGVISLQLSAFGYCSRLEYIVLPKSLTTIQYACFNETTALDDVYYKGSVEERTANLTINNNLEYNSQIVSTATWHYYSETEPTDTTYSYWHYVNGTITLW